MVGAGLKMQRKMEAMEPEVGGNQKHYSHWRVIYPSFPLVSFLIPVSLWREIIPAAN